MDISTLLVFIVGLGAMLAAGTRAIEPATRGRRRDPRLRPSSTIAKSTKQAMGKMKRNETGLANLAPKILRFVRQTPSVGG